MIDAKEDKELAPSDVSTRLSFYSPDAYRNSVQLPVVTITSSHSTQGHTTFHHRHLIWSRYFSGLHFPTLALYVFCDQSQKMPPPPPTRTPQVAPKLYPSLVTAVPSADMGSLSHRCLQGCPEPPPPPPCVTFCRETVSLRGRGQSPVLPFACCVGSLCSVGRCGRCSCWCRFRVHGAQWSVCRGCAGCGGICRLRVSSAR